MFKNFLERFDLTSERESIKKISESISSNVEFKGTNLWILICAIFIASLGLNVNSTAVIIGAMLISPLMGPIMGMGLSIGTLDFTLYKRSLKNFLVATAVGLITSTLFFIISPLNEAHSEILSRTQPNIYDVLIAFFGGIAGIIATSSKQKGNVIPGVAIATALMPPLCTAGFGLATGHLSYFFGAFYLYTINTVFIALATMLTVRVLNLPRVKELEESDQKRYNFAIWAVTLATLIPSIYLGYQMVRDRRIERSAAEFINRESQLPNEFLLNSNIDMKNKQLVLTYAGSKMDSTQIMSLQKKFLSYGFDTSQFKLIINQGFEHLYDAQNQENQLLTENNQKIQHLNFVIDSIQQFNKISPQLYKEVKVLYPDVDAMTIQSCLIVSDSTSSSIPVCLIKTSRNYNTSEKLKLKEWIQTRIGLDRVFVQFYNDKQVEI